MAKNFNEENMVCTLFDYARENDAKGIQISIPMSKFTDHINSCLRSCDIELIRGIATPEEQENNKLVQYIVGDETIPHQPNAFGCNDVNLLDRLPDSYDGKPTIYNGVSISRVKPFVKGMGSWIKPFSVEDNNNAIELYISNGVIKGNYFNLLHVDDRLYNAALLATGRYGELGKRASLDQIKELIELGSASSYQLMISRHNSAQEYRENAYIASQSGALLEKIRKVL